MLILLVLLLLVAVLEQQRMMESFVRNLFWGAVVGIAFMACFYTYGFYLYNANRDKAVREFQECAQRGGHMNSGTGWICAVPPQEMTVSLDVPDDLLDTVQSEFHPVANVHLVPSNANRHVVIVPNESGFNCAVYSGRDQLIVSTGVSFRDCMETVSKGTMYFHTDGTPRVE